MKNRILPGAAGLIALTATIGFTDWYREVDIESYSRNTISLVSIQLDDGIKSSLTNQLPAEKSAKKAYLVEIRRGNTTAEVKIDARTGRILSA